MKLYIPIKDFIIAPGKKLDPESFSEKDIRVRIRQLYGVIAKVMDISIKDDMIEIEFKDATPERFNFAMQSLKKGVKAADKGQLSKALKHFQEVLEVIPENIDARRNMAKIYLSKNNPQKAKQNLQECLQIDPKDAYSSVMLGNLYARDENNFDLAAFYYDLCLEHHPDDAYCMTNYASLMTEKGDFQKAEIFFKKAIKIQDIPNAYYGLALLYRMANELEVALQVLETFFTRTATVQGLERLPVYKEAKNLYREISKILDVAQKGH